jgi:hypothetical protein
MIRKIAHSALCIVLAPLLIAQQTAATPPALRENAQTNPVFVTLHRGTEIKLVLLESASASTAMTGQQLRMAVAEDVIVGGWIVIPKDTPATGEVADLIKPVRGKRNGYLGVKPVRLSLPDGHSIRLREYPPGEDACADMGPCWVLYTLFAPLVIIGLLKTTISNRNLDETGNDRLVQIGEDFSAYTGRNIRLQPVRLGSGTK